MFQVWLCSHGVIMERCPEGDLPKVMGSYTEMYRVREDARRPDGELYIRGNKVPDREELETLFTDFDTSVPPTLLWIHLIFTPVVNAHIAGGTPFLQNEGQGQLHIAGVMRTPLNSQRIKPWHGNDAK